MAGLPWNLARGLILWIGLAGPALPQAPPAAGIQVHFAAAVPSGTVYTGVPVELVATLKVTSPEGLTRDTLVHQRGFNPRVRWKASNDSFRDAGTGAVLGTSTRPPNGLVFVSRGTYVPPPLPGDYTVTAYPEADPSQAVSLRVVVEDLALRLHPGEAVLAPGQEQPFVATFHGPPGAPLVWTATGGSVSPLGAYQAPAVPGSHTVTVQHVPSGKRASALITVANVFRIQPATLELGTGESAQLRGPEHLGPIIWSIQEPEGGTIGPDGTYTAPRKPGTYSILAIQAADASRKATATVRVNPVTLSLFPRTITLGPGQRIRFEADLSHGTCLWSATGGEITEDGLYRAPLTLGTCEVTATSALDPEVRATATVDIHATGLLQVEPEDLTLHVGQTQQFLVPGLPGEAAPTWLVQPPWAGTITEDGLFTAGSAPMACSVTALLEDRVSTASVRLIDTRILPDPARVKPGSTLQFTAQGLEGPVSWRLSPASAGTLSADGLFTAGLGPGDCQVSATAGGVDVSASVRILAVRISPEEVLVAPGGTVRFTCDTFDAPGSGMTWRLLGDQPGAFLGQDGHYKAPTQQGIYRISASDSGGNDAQATVLVGPPNGLMLVPEIRVEQDGMYTVWVRLKASNGRTVIGSFTGELRRGLAYPEIVFPARQMLMPLGVDGPYTIARIVITGALDDATVVFDVRENLGLTEPFSIEESTRDWIRIGEIAEVKGRARPATGLLESLLVSIPVELTADGEYRVKASLTSEDGTEIDAYAETRVLTRGSQDITLSFDGRKIRARGVTGPLSITRFTVEGPVARSRDFPGSIKGYDFRMFEP